MEIRDLYLENRQPAGVDHPANRDLRTLSIKIPTVQRVVGKI